MNWSLEKPSKEGLYWAFSNNWSCLTPVPVIVENRIRYLTDERPLPDDGWVWEMWARSPEWCPYIGDRLLEKVSCWWLGPVKSESPEPTKADYERSRHLWDPR